MLEMDNKSMGGVDKSDQLISYHKISRRTKKYWKTIFSHYIDIAVVNSHVLFNFVCLQQAKKPVSENVFRDKLILDIIPFYGVEKRPHKVSAHKVATFRVYHGSKLYSSEDRAKCVYCHLHNAKNTTQRKCPDCQLLPALCQTVGRDCHSAWHSEHFAVIRKLWYEHREKQSSSTPNTSRGRGRPKGSINRSKRRGSYRARRNVRTIESYLSRTIFA